MFGRTALMDQTVQHVSRYYGSDERGNDAWQEDPPVDVEHCSVQPLDSVEYLSSASDQVVSRWQFFGPPGMDLKATDLIRADGKEYEIDGQPGLNRAVSPLLSHTSAVLKEVTG